MSGPSAIARVGLGWGHFIFFNPIWSCMHRWVNPSVFTVIRTRSTSCLRDDQWMEAAWWLGDELLLCTGAMKPVVLAVPYHHEIELRRWRRAWYLTIAKLLLLLCESDLFNLSNTRIRRAMLLWCRLPESCTNTTTATWLILPVVICLSKRLSHACLSMSIIQRDCERLIKTVMVYLMVHCYLDNRSNSRANTCTKGRLWSPVFIRLKPTTSGCFGES